MQVCLNYFTDLIELYVQYRIFYIHYYSLYTFWKKNKIKFLLNVQFTHICGLKKVGTYQVLLFVELSCLFSGAICS